MSNDLSVLKNFKHDLPASIVVFLVALPLCLGIALASGAPLFSGIIAGVVGGIIVASFSKSSLSVCGPAAGLTTIVANSIHSLNNVYEVFLSAVFIAGAFQFLLGAIKAGTIGNYFPSAVIKGMLTSIGIILILKQLPHAVGFDKDYVGDFSFVQKDGNNTFTELINAINYVSPGAIIITLVSLFILIVMERPAIKKMKFTSLIPAPLIVVLGGVLMNEFFILNSTSLQITSEHLVSLPVSHNAFEFFGQFTFPSFSQIGNFEIWKVALTIAIVASLETLLSIDAVDKLDPYRRITPLNQELRAQGIGNMVCGLIGCLPVTSVIVRSSANVSSGGRTKMSSIFHGVLLLITVFLIPGLLNKIPYASLAAILLTVGYKLAKPSIFKELFKKGYDQFLPFIITIIAILFTDLLIGISIGIVIGLIFILKSDFHQAFFTVNDKGNYLIRLTRDVSFLNKALLRKTFREIPNNSFVVIDGARSKFIDADILEAIEDFRKSAENRNIRVELKQSVSSSNSIFKA